MKFDAREAKLLAPGAHIIMDDYPGLRLKATTTGRAWIYRYKSQVDGKMRQIKIGDWPALSAPAAIVKWESLKQDRDAGLDPAANKRSVRKEEIAAEQAQRAAAREEKFTVARLCDDYLIGHINRHRARKGAIEITRMFNTMLGDLGQQPAAGVTRLAAFEFLEQFLDIPVQGQKLRAELGAAWDYALDAGRLPENTPNWWRLVMKGRFRSQGKAIAGVKVGKKKRVLTEEEVSTLIPWIPNFSKSLADIVTLYLWTAQRGSEIVAIMGGEVFEEADGLWWVIPKAKTKNARHEEATDQRVPLVGRAKAIIQRRMELFGKGYLFPNQKKNGHLEQKMVQTSIYMHQPYSKTRPENYRPRLTVSHWAPHDLRRTSRTMLASLGCPEEVAEAIIGHMKPGIVGVYNLHTYDRERREWLARLDLHLEQLAASHAN